MAKKVMILTEGGSKIGLGHITRCLALYEAFKEYDLEPILVVNGDNKVDEFLQKQKVQYRIENWLEKAESIRDSVLIIDSYLAPEEVYSTLRKNNLVVAIDDNNRIQYDADVVISPTIYGEFLNYRNYSVVTYLLGSRYILLRKPFWEVPPKMVNVHIKDILITFGGEDLRNLTPRILESLKDKGYNLHVVVGNAFKETSYISKYEKYPNIKFYIDLSAEEMMRLMLLSDVAISSCGQTLHELARVGVPTVGVVVAENQKLNAQYFEKAGFLVYAGGYWDNNLEKNISESLELLSDYNERKFRSKIGRKLVDGLGAKRIVSEVIKHENRYSGG